MSIFTNQDSIRAWQEAPLNRQSNHALLLRCALNELHSLYCLDNPERKSPLRVRKTVFEYFTAANAMFFEGLARKEGFGCKQDLRTGQSMIRVAAVAKDCPEALNYLGLYYFSADKVASAKLFKRASLLGHKKAGDNLQYINYLINNMSPSNHSTYREGQRPRILCTV